MGAYLSEEYGQNSDEVITVSKPTTPGDLLTGKKKGKDQYDIRTTCDPIAVLQNFQKGEHDIVIPSQSWNPYKEHIGDLVSGRLLPEDRLIATAFSKAQGLANAKALADPDCSVQKNADSCVEIKTVSKTKDKNGIIYTTSYQCQCGMWTVKLCQQ